MFTSAKDIMKIIWNGLKEIKKNCSEYCEKDARKIYEETLERVKDELSGPEPEEIRKERLVRNRWEKMRADRKIAAVSILTILASQASVQAEYAQKDNYPFFGYEFISAYTVTWNSGCMTSLYTDQYTYTGGAHGSTIRTSDTWDFSSGRYLTLADFYPHNPSYREGIYRNLEQQVKEREKESSSTYFDDYSSLIRSTFKPENFFVTPKGIVIYFQQYDIAPYSTGIPEFLIPFKRNR